MSDIDELTDEDAWDELDDGDRTDMIRRGMLFDGGKLSFFARQWALTKRTFRRVAEREPETK